MSRPADLCCYQLPSGKRCRQITLKQEQFCRHHRRLFRQSESEMALQEAMQRLAGKLLSLDLPDLLETLYATLARVSSTVRTIPEAQLALGITMERLRTELLFTAPEPSPTPVNFPENPMESMNQDGGKFLKTMRNQ